MAYKLGLDCKLYYKVGGVAGGGAWVLMNNVRDLKLGMESDRADLTTRGSGGFRQEVATLKAGNIAFAIVWDTADAGFTAFQTAYFANAIIGIRALDAVSPAGQGLQSDMSIFKFDRNEQLAEGVTVDIELGIAYGATPSWGTF